MTGCALAQPKKFGVFLSGTSITLQAPTDITFNFKYKSHLQSTDTYERVKLSNCVVAKWLRWRISTR
jgi:hypothetical protein